ncbi:MAG: hypothetical protein KTR31_21775 [Myxococcales bacterium]|nr:hypothetical protein [Myxococcales bacterium]
MRWIVGVWVMVNLTACKSEGNFFEQTGNDTWAQAPNNEVDILWVIDNSTSMVEEQESLADGFVSFASEMEDSGTDFHIGVISTAFENGDAAAGRLIGDPPYLTAADAYQDAFVQRATVGVTEVVRADKEKGLAAAAFALNPVMTLDGGPNAGFIRPSAQLLVVFVSDEDDCSDNGALDALPAEACYEQYDQLTPYSVYVQDLRQLKPDPTLVQVGAIVGTESSACDGVFNGRRYISSALLTGGIVGDICQADYSQILGDLGLTAVGLRASFQLSNAAKPETLKVWVDDAEIDEGEGGWTYDAASWVVTFAESAIPPRGSVISASYTIQPGATGPAGTATTP